jgi:hypothetical protein
MAKTRFGYGLFRGRLAQRLEWLTENQYQAVLDHEHLEKQLIKAVIYYIDGVISRKEACFEWSYVEADLTRFDGLARSIAMQHGKEYPPELKPVSSLSQEELDYRAQVTELMAIKEGRYHLHPDDDVVH